MKSLCSLSVVVLVGLTILQSCSQSSSDGKSRDTEVEQSETIAGDDLVAKLTPSRQADWIKPFSQIDHWQKYPEYADVEWHPNEVVVQFSDELAGLIWKGDLPKAPYELELEARRLSGADFFCGLTFPVRNNEEQVSLILGGWGGATVGISAIDGLDASNAHNPTHFVQGFQQDKWYNVRLEVRPDRLTFFLDGVKKWSILLDGKKLSLRRGPIEDYTPLSISTFQTDGHFKNLRWRSLK